MRERQTPAGDVARPLTGTSPDEAPTVASGTDRWVVRWAARCCLPAASVLWLLSLRDVNLRGMRDFGLLQVLPVLFWVALALLALGFCMALAGRRTGHGWFACHVLALIAVIHATPALLYPTLRYSWAWKHVAVVDAVIRRNGEVPSAEKLSLYNQWPGFFELNAFVLRATGLESAMSYAAWVPPVLNVLLLGPLLLLYRSLTRDRRLIWAGVWVFYSCSWVGQDYFAPQAFAFLLFVTVLALVVGQLPGSARSPAGAVRPGRWPVGRLLVVLLIEAVVVASHPLTPLMLISALVALALPRRNRRVVLPALAGAVLLTLLWDATVARSYVAANLDRFLSALLQADANVSSGLASLGTAAPGQVVVSWADRVLSAGVLLLAVAAFLARPWLRRSGLPLLVVSPLPLLAANAYGGEMIFRAYLFALPAAAFLVAALLLPPGGGGASARPWPWPRPWTLALWPVFLALLTGLVFGYYGKESANHFTEDEVAAVRFVTATAPPGAVIVTVTSTVPGLYTDYDLHSRVQLDEQEVDDRRRLVNDPVAGLEPFLSRTTPRRPAYIILSRAQAADSYLRGVMPADTVDRMDAALSRARGFVRVYGNQDAVVYLYVYPREGR